MVVFKIHVPSSGNAGMQLLQVASNEIENDEAIADTIQRSQSCSVQ